MPKYLIVAEQSLGGDRLREQVRARLGAEAASLRVLVPATGGDRMDATSYPEVIAAGAQGPDRSGGNRAEEAAWGSARRRLGHQVASLQQLGLEVDGEVGDPNPLEAIKQVLEREQFDEILLCSPSQPISRQLSLDLAHRIRRAFDLPVTHCTDATPPEP
jgi:hypothetical protein